MSKKLYTLIGLFLFVAVIAYQQYHSQGVYQRISTLEIKNKQLADSTQKVLELLKLDETIMKENLQQTPNTNPEETRATQDWYAQAVELRQAFQTKINRQPISFTQPATEVDSAQINSLMSKEIAGKSMPKTLVDSLKLALVKSNILIQQLKRNETSKLSYLEFENTKGSKVYYVGQVKDGKAEGRGVGLMNSGSRYVGEWVNNRKHGVGVYYWKDGERYEGEYIKDKRSGRGTYYWTDGKKYVGEWQGDFRNGQGVVYTVDGEVLAQGLWLKDELVEVDKSAK